MTKFKTNYDWTNYSMAIDIAETAAEEFNSGNYDDINNAVYDEIDRQLIYTCDQWEIMKEYQSPDEANLQEAIESLINEVYEILEEYEEEEEEEEEEFTIIREDTGEIIHINAEIKAYDEELQDVTLYVIKDGFAGRKQYMLVNNFLMSRGYTVESYIHDEAGEDVLNDIYETNDKVEG